MVHQHRAPIIHPTVTRYIKNTDWVDTTAHHTHPCKISFPGIFQQNVQAMQEMLDHEMIDYKIYFANKATKSDTFVRAALQSGIAIDVSSEQELADALAIGYDTQNIIANGPKSIGFLRLCLENDVMISVDSIGEIRKILDSDISSQSKIMMRVCPPREINHSRFGITEADMIAHQAFIAELHKAHSIHGLNFHIDSINAQDKQHMIRHIVDVREKLTDRGVHIEQLGIGGGFGVQYTAGVLQGQFPREYPQTKRTYKIHAIEELLDTEIEPGLSLVQYLRESMTTLHLEPGRMLLDQCGICVHHVIDQKDDMIIIDGNMYSLGSIGQEMPHDPLVYSGDNKVFSHESHEYYVYGNLCMEADRIFSRKLILPNNISIGDMLIFINTAAYFADFSDSQPIKHNERKEIVVR